MKYYYFDSNRLEVGNTQYLEIFATGKKESNTLDLLTTRQQRIIYCEDLHEGYYISTNKRDLLKIIKDVLSWKVEESEQKELYRQLRNEILSF